MKLIVITDSSDGITVCLEPEAKTLVAGEENANAYVVDTDLLKPGVHHLTYDPTFGKTDGEDYTGAPQRPIIVRHSHTSEV